MTEGISADIPTKGPKGWRRRYATHAVDDDGWTDWIRPAQGYRMGCCDCGLVHELEFRVVNVDDVEFRARRNSRSTAAKRRSFRND
jgi:hypothetical protein